MGFTEWTLVIIAALMFFLLVVLVVVVQQRGERHNKKQVVIVDQNADWEAGKPRSTDTVWTKQQARHYYPADDDGVAVDVTRGTARSPSPGTEAVRTHFYPADSHSHWQMDTDDAPGTS